MGASKGGKHKRKSKSGNMATRELIFREDEQIYAIVSKMLGGCNVMADSFTDGTIHLCHIRGKMKRKVWIAVGDVVLLSARDFQADKYDVIHKYTADEARALRKYGEIPSMKRELGEGAPSDDEDVFSLDDEDEID